MERPPLGVGVRALAALSGRGSFQSEGWGTGPIGRGAPKRDPMPEEPAGAQGDAQDKY